MQAWSKLPWKVLPRFLDLGHAFYAEMQRARAEKRAHMGLQAKAAPAGKRRPETRLKVTEPWQGI